MGVVTMMGQSILAQWLWPADLPGFVRSIWYPDDGEFARLPVARQGRSHPARRQWARSVPVR